MDRKVVRSIAAVSAALLLAAALPAQRVGRKQLREMILAVGDEDREAKLAEIREKYAFPFRESLRKARYVPGGSNADTREFVFKTTPSRELKLYVDYPPGWSPGDRRAALVMWHGGGFTQGGANQFLAQCDYFNKRGMVCVRPEYRLADLDDAPPHLGIEDGVSAMRWIRSRTDELGVDPAKIAVGGGSAGGCIAAVLSTLDVRRFAEMGFIGPGEDPSMWVKPAAAILYNPFVDFFEPLSERHVEEELTMFGLDPENLRDVYRLLSAVDQLRPDSPPNIIQFGTQDAFYPQQIRWIVRARELGVLTRDYAYKGEVHSWFSNSPHIEYTTENVDRFLQEVGMLGPEPRVELPHKPIHEQRRAIQDAKYTGKNDWDEQERFRRYVRENGIEIRKAPVD